MSKKVCPICRNGFFHAKQEAILDVTVDGNNDALEEMTIGESKAPSGPYVCNVCGSSFNGLETLMELEDGPVGKLTCSESVTEFGTEEEFLRAVWDSYHYSVDLSVPVIYDKDNTALAFKLFNLKREAEGKPAISYSEFLLFNRNGLYGKERMK